MNGISMRNHTRMVEFMLLAVALYALAVIIPWAQFQTACWKLGHITSGATIGYWIDRQLFGRINYEVSVNRYRYLCRAALVGASILGMAFGL